MSYLKLPVVAQLVGAVVFGVSFWKGVHGFWVSAGLLSGAGLAYVGRHFNTLINTSASVIQGASGPTLKQ
jgi:hypothetical protein